MIGNKTSLCKRRKNEQMGEKGETKCHGGDLVGFSMIGVLDDGIV